MAGQIRALIKQGGQDLSAACRDATQIMKSRGPSQLQFWFIALGVGIAAGFAALLFRLGINWLQGMLYGTDDVSRIHSFAANLAWYQILILPVAGGLIVGLILHWFTDDARARSVPPALTRRWLGRFSR